MSKSKQKQLAGLSAVGNHSCCQNLSQVQLAPQESTHSMIRMVSFLYQGSGRAGLTLASWWVDNED
jgi:hypothetical protein